MVSLFHCCDPVVRENTMLVRVPVRACQEAERERENNERSQVCPSKISPRDISPGPHLLSFPHQ